MTGPLGAEGVGRGDNDAAACVEVFVWGATCCVVDTPGELNVGMFGNVFAEGEAEFALAVLVTGKVGIVGSGGSCEVLGIAVFPAVFVNVDSCWLGDATVPLVVPARMPLRTAIHC